MTSKEFKATLKALYKEGGIANIVNVLAEVLEDESTEAWSDGCLRISNNLDYIAQVFEYLVYTVDINYTQANQDDLVYLTEKLIQDLDELKNDNHP